jgi:hypothetical protein
MSTGDPHSSRPSTSGKAADFQQLLNIALSGDRNAFVDAVERVGVAAMMDRDELGNTLLHLVAAAGDLKMIKLLLQLGVVADSHNDGSETASMVADAFGNSAISEYLNRKILERNPTVTPAVAHSSNTQRDAPVNEGDVGDDFQNEYLDAVLAYAIVLGIDSVNEPHLLAIAEEGLGAPLPDDWQQHDGAYVNIKTSQVQTEHPNDSIFKQRVVEARERSATYHKAEERVEYSRESDFCQQQAEEHSKSDFFEEHSKSYHEEGEESASYDEDFDAAPEEDSENNFSVPKESSPGLIEGHAKPQDTTLDDEAVRTMILLQERLKLKTRDMERYGRQTHRAVSPDFMPHTLPLSDSTYGKSTKCSPSKDRKASKKQDIERFGTLPTVKSSTSEFDRLMKRYMGFSSTQAALSFDDRRQRQRAVKEAIKGIRAKHDSITASLRQFLDSKALNTIAAATGANDFAKNTPNATLPMINASQKERESLRAPQLSASPLQGSARPPNNPWILQRKFTMLFNPEHMKPSKSSSVYAKLKPAYMEGRNLQSPSVSVALYPSINPNRMSDDNDAYAFMLDPRRRHKLIAKQMERSDRPHCASPWSPELKKSGVWDKNGYLDCNAFMFGDK